MAFIPVADAAKVALKFTLFGQQCVNTMWFTKSGGWTSEDLVDLCTAVNSWCVAELMPNASHDVVFNGSTAVDMSAAGQEGVEVQLTPGEEGGNGSDALPSNVTAAIKFLTGFTGRSNRGRNFFIGLAPNTVADDNITTTVQGTLLAAYDALASYLTGLAAEHVVASLYSGVDSEGKPIPRSAGVVKAVTQYAMDTTIDSMRRRLIGRGT